MGLEAVRLQIVVYMLLGSVSIAAVERTITIGNSMGLCNSTCCKTALKFLSFGAPAYTGLRQGELLGLERGHVEGTTIVLDARTKSGRVRAVPVPPVATPILADIPFACTYHILRWEFEAARVRVGLPHIRFHDLRHTYASVLVQRGVRLKTVGEILGHSSTVVTDRYAHLAPEHLQAAVDRAFTATPTATEME